MTKRTLGIAILLTIALLDFAALDDITTGVEPNFIAEWVTVLLSLPLAWLTFRWVRRAHTP